jgi:flagellar biosynthesis anti-sigma factor FlgM
MQSALGLRSLLDTTAYDNSGMMPIRNVNPVNEALSSGHSASLSPLADAAYEYPPTDTADLSGLGTLMAQAVSEPDVRMEKVAALRENIGNGTYKVSAMDVAVGLMASMIW